MQCGRFGGRWRWSARSSALALGAIFLAVAFAHPARAQSAAAIRGASQYGEGHVVTRTLQRFEELVRQYYGKPVEFVLQTDAARGLERQYFTAISQGALDYAIVAPVHMTESSSMARLIEAPFLFRDAAHWNATLGSGALKPFIDEIAAKADVMIIGFAGGSVRSIFANPALTAEDLKGLSIRVPGAPPWREVFTAAGLAPRVVALNALYGKIQQGAIAATEGDAATIEAMKLFEVAPNLVPSAHAIAIRPLCFSAKTFRALPPELQAAILQAGADATAFGRRIEQVEDAVRLDALETEGKLRRVPLEARGAIKEAADPVIAAYAREIGAEALLGAINEAK